MKTARRTLILLSLALVPPTLVAQEPKIPQGPPLPELVGRWMEKTADRKGDLTGYHFYLFSRKSEFLILTRVRNEKTKTWVEAKKLYRKELPVLQGYFEARRPDQLNFNLVVLAMAVLPFEIKYSIHGETLSLSKNFFDPDSGRGVICRRVAQWPNETKKEAAALAKRLEGGLNGPDFAKVFERAAHEMTPHPSDEAMIGNFDHWREDFENLRIMLQTDKGLERVDSGLVKPDDPGQIGITPERIEQYRALCKKLGLERGVEAFGEGATRIEFLASCRGLSTSGSSKTYRWLKDPPTATEGRALVKDLDAFVRQRHEERALYFKSHKQAMPGHADAYRPIEGKWYLHYQD